MIRYNSLKITVWMVIKYFAKTFFNAYFSDNKTIIEGGYTFRYDAYQTWYYLIRPKLWPNSKFLLDSIWYENASEELQESRAAFEEYDDQLLRYM